MKLDMGKELILYLDKYGNTQENDLINYGVQKRGQTETSMKQLVNDMLLHGQLERVVHGELSPPVTYIKEGEVAFLEKQMQAISISLGHGKLSREEMDAAHEILCKAAEDAEKKIEERTRQEKYGVESKIILAQAKEIAKKNKKVRRKVQSRKESNRSSEGTK